MKAVQGRESRGFHGAQRQPAARRQRSLGRGEDGREEDHAGDIEKAAKGKKLANTFHNICIHKISEFFPTFKFALGEIRRSFLVEQDDQSHARLDILFLLLFPLFFLVFNCIYWLRYDVLLKLVRDVSIGYHVILIKSKPTTTPFSSSATTALAPTAR